jgi:hypothetical protein
VPMGICIEYKEDQLVDACVRLMNDDAFYDLCARNASAYIKDLTWDLIYAEVL